MPVAIFKTPVEVVGRLSDLGVTQEQLLEIVHAMVGAKAACTDNDPPSAPGWSSWRHGIRRSREVLRPHGWLIDDGDQLSCIVNHSLGMRITVANTDDATGIGSPEAVPQIDPRKARPLIARSMVLSIFCSVPSHRNETRRWFCLFPVNGIPVLTRHSMYACSVMGT